MNWKVTIAAVCLSLTSLAFAPPAVGNDAAVRKQAEAVFAAAGVKGGLVVHVGCGDGRLTAALRKDGTYVIHGLDTDPARIDEARKHIRSLGLYGPVSVETFDGKHLPYTDNLVNVVVRDTGCKIRDDEIMRVLSPGGLREQTEGHVAVARRRPAAVVPAGGAGECSGCAICGRLALDRRRQAVRYWQATHWTFVGCLLRGRA